MYCIFKISAMCCTKTDAVYENVLGSETKMANLIDFLLLEDKELTNSKVIDKDIITVTQ